MKSEISSAFGSEYYRIILDAMPCPVFVVKEDVQIVDFNTAAEHLMEQDRSQSRPRHAGELLQCLHAHADTGGCGHAEACQDCLIRQAVKSALEGNTPPRSTVRIDLMAREKQTEGLFLISVAPLLVNNLRMALLILEDIREITLLRQILPICPHCKQVRNDEDYWQNVESYLSSHVEPDHSHSLCPECSDKLFPENARQSGFQESIEAAQEAAS